MAGPLPGRQYKKMVNSCKKYESFFVEFGQQGQMIIISGSGNSFKDFFRGVRHAEHVKIAFFNESPGQ